MENKVFDSVTGNVATGSPLITAPGNSCEDSLNIVFPQQGSACTRQGHSVYGPIDPDVDSTTPHPVLTDWGYITQYPWPDPRYAARYNGWRSCYQYKIFNVNQTTNITGILSSKPVLPGLKVDRSAAYGTYNPKEGFTDAIIGVNQATGTSMLGWIGNNGVTQGFSNVSAQGVWALRDDLYRGFGQAEGVGPLFSGAWNSGFFDACVTNQMYNFLDFKQARIVQSDYNMWLRAVQQKDLVSTYDTTSVPAQGGNSDTFYPGALPARTWISAPRLKVSLYTCAARYNSDQQGWLKEGYAVDFFAVIRVTDETGYTSYGPPSPVATCRNFHEGLAEVLFSPNLPGGDASLCKAQTLEIYRTKQYKWFGTSVSVAPTEYYLCYSLGGDKLYDPITGSVIPTPLKLSSVHLELGGDYAAPSTTPFATFSITAFPNQLALDIGYATDVTDCVVCTKIGSSNTSLTTPSSTTDVTANIYVAGNPTVGTLTRMRKIYAAYDLVLPVRDKRGVQDILYFTLQTDDGVVGDLLRFTVPVMYKCLVLSLTDDALIEPWVDGFEGVQQDTFPLIAGAVASDSRIIGYNTVLPPTVSLNQSKIANSTSLYGIDNTLFLQNTSDLYFTLSSPLLDKHTGTTDSTNSLDSDLGYAYKGALNVMNTAVTTYSFVSAATELNYDPTIYKTGTIIDQPLNDVEWNSLAKTFTCGLLSVAGSWATLPSTGVIILWYAVSQGFGVGYQPMDILSYSGGVTVTVSGGRRIYAFQQVESQHVQSYSSPISITSGVVCASIITASGVKAVPIWVYDNNVSLGTCITRFKGSSPKLPYIETTAAPTGFVDNCSIDTYADTGWDYGAVPNYRPAISNMNFRPVRYLAETPADGMAEALRTFASEYNTRVPDLVNWSKSNPLNLSISKNYYGYLGSGLGTKTTYKQIALGFAEGSLLDQVFDTTLVQEPAVFPDLSAISSHVPNGIAFSKPNRYDVCEPLGNLKRVGDDNKPITNIVAFNGALYIFKEEEGIYRMIVDESNTFASVITLIDNTHWMVSNKSVQLVMDGLYFVSNRGISILTSSEQIIDISDPIQQEVAGYIANVAANADLGTHPQERLAKIGSYGNEARRLYAAHFPRCGSQNRGVTLLYSGNTNQWSKSDQRFEAAWTVQDKTYTVEPIYTLDNNGNDTMVREATLFKKDNGTFDLYATADQHDGQFLTSTVVFDKYGGPGPTENPLYKYDPVYGQIDIQDSSFSTPTDGRGIMNFYKANKDKYVYVDLFGDRVKTVVTPKPATTGLQVSGYVRDESMITDGKTTDELPFEKLDYVYFSGITCNYNGPESLIAATGTTFSFEPALMYNGTFTGPTGKVSTNLRTLVTNRGRKDSQGVLLSKLLVSMNTAWAPTMPPYIYRIKDKNGRDNSPRIMNLRADLYALMAASGYDGIDIDVEGYWQGFVTFRASSIDASTLQPKDTGSQPAVLNQWTWEVDDTIHIQELTGTDEYSEASWTTRHTTTIASVVDPDPTNSRNPSWDFSTVTKIGLTTPYSIPTVGQYRVKHDIDIPARTEAFIAEMHANKPVGAILATAVAMDSANPVTPFGPNHIRNTAKYFDVINLMAYDFQRDVTTHNAPLYNGNPPFNNWESTGINGIDHYMPYYYSIEVAPGVLLDKRKLVLGFPAYSWQWGNVTDPRDGGYRKPGSIVWGSSPWPPPLLDRPQVDYCDLYNAYRNNTSYTFYTDATDKVKWMYNLGEVTIGTATYQGHWANFEDAEVMNTKATYAKNQGLGGIFYWHLNGDLPIDHRDSLIAKAYDVIGFNPGSILRAQLVDQPYPAYPTASTPSPAAPMYVSIMASLTFNKYFVAGNQGKSRFLEGFVTSRGSCEGVQMSFLTSEVGVWTDACYLPKTSEVFRTFVPREACIGRWIQMKAEHHKPMEFFKPYSMGYRFRQFQQPEKSTRNTERA